MFEGIGFAMKLEWRTCFKIGVSIFLLYICITYWKSVAELLGAVFSAASPLLIGCAVAYIVNILMIRYEKMYMPRSKKKFVNKSRRPVCMVAAYITVVAIVVLVIALILPQLTSCIMIIVAEAPNAIRSVINYVENLHVLPDNIFDVLDGIDWKSRITEIIGVVTSGVGNVVNMLVNTVTSVFSGIITALISIIFSFYLLSGKDKLRNQFTRIMKRYLKPSWFENTMYALTIFHNCFRKYITGQCIEAVILGALCAIGMTIIGLPYATMIGALVAFTALIPVAGAYIGAIIGAFMIMTVSPMQALIFLVFIIVLQQLEGNLIYPRVVGSSMGLPGIWVLAAVTIGGGIMGILGMLLGVPIAAVIYKMIANDVNGTKKV